MGTASAIRIAGSSPCLERVAVTWQQRPARKQKSRSQPELEGERTVNLTRISGVTSYREDGGTETLARCARAHFRTQQSCGASMTRGGSLTSGGEASLAGRIRAAARVRGRAVVLVEAPARDRAGGMSTSAVTEVCRRCTWPRRDGARRAHFSGGSCTSRHPFARGRSPRRVRVPRPRSVERASPRRV